jgi:UDPglucose--hexose-1-phosphate uridylyltransferase
MPDTPHADTAPQIRHDPLTGRAVFVAPGRSGKPDDDALATAAGDRGVPDGWCPFCAGNEARTPADVVRAPDDVSRPWHARIVPNRYPITLDRPPEGVPPAPHARPSHGIHDVVIESPRHDRSILAVPPEAWRDVWELCRRRLAMVADRGSLARGTVFKNSGSRAGASLEHVHSQIVAMDVVPPVVRAELDALRGGADPFGRLVAEARGAGRIVAEADGLLALVPPAPRQPFETWIVTDTPERHFHATSPGRVASLAALTRDLVGRLDRLAPGCAYNWWLHQAPFAADDDATAAWHWHLEIVPRLSEFAGFEIGTGCHITTMSAEVAARRLGEAAG